MNILRTEDASIIKSVMCHPEIYDRISMDHMPGPDEYEPEIDGHYYLIAYNNDELIGCVVFHHVSYICLEVHVHVLPSMRKHAHEFVESCKAWAWENTKALKIIAQIPVIYPDVIKFSEERGMAIEGVNRLSYLKNEELHDQVYMGVSYG